MANMKAVSELSHKHGIKVVLDATRNIENAYFIQQREEGYKNRSVEDINREFAPIAMLRQSVPKRFVCKYRRIGYV
jgi:tyrosine phenol-lyase (EC 4.1.99.2)